MYIQLLCERSHVSLKSDGFDGRRPLVPERLIALADRYAAAREASDMAALLAIGRELYGWLDGAEAWLAQVRARLTGAFVLEICAAVQPTAADWAVLHAPWELLADPTEMGFLAGDAERAYAPARRLGPAGATPPTDRYRLGIAFMAAAPRGTAPELDFEAEEAAIMAVAGREIDLLVDESGDASELGKRLRFLDPPPTVLHLSCHGHNAWKGATGEAAAQPVLLLEDALGAERPTNVGDLIEALGGYRPRLLFLSACLTAAGDKSGPDRAMSDSLASRLVRHDFPAVLGWDGSVADVAATAFASTLYTGLDRGQTLPLAAAAARRGLLNGLGAAGGGLAGKDPHVGAQLAARLRSDNDVLRRDWHLARVWLGPSGGGPVIGGQQKRSLLPLGAGTKHLLTAKRGERLEVADATMFVGRRRELQRALRSLAGSDHAGVLLHGMGRLGKSSLAARLSDRRSDLTLVVIFGAYDAVSVVDALAKALEEHEPATKLLRDRRAQVMKDAGMLRPLLVQLLSGPCKWINDLGRPILLLVDDLERILDADPNGGRHRVALETRPVLAALLHAFDPERSASRLLLTSRFPFTLVENGTELADKLEAIELGELGETSSRKLTLRQIKAAQTAAQGPKLTDAELERRLPLLARVPALARGNPGLQDLLGADFVLCPAVPAARAEAVLDEMAAYLDGGALPQSKAVREFLQNLALDALIRLAGPSNAALLRAATLFDHPVPEAVIAALAAKLGGDMPRLRDLGLLVPAEDLVAVGTKALGVNGLASGRLTGLSLDEQQALAPLALPTLFAAWGGTEHGDRRPDAADIELARLGMLAGDLSIVATCAADAVQGLANAGRPADASTLGQDAAAMLRTADAAVPLRLLARTAATLRTAGDGEGADALLRLADGAIRSAEPDEHAEFLLVRARRQRQAGDPDAALASLELLCALLAKLGAERRLAVARGEIADILRARGALDEALRIRREEELPVYTRLGDVRSIAVTQGQIADILHSRGALDEALRIHREETLPVYTRLGDVRSIAITQGRIADILHARGALDEALRIRREEELPVYTRLGDVRSIAVTQGKIAQILLAQGDIDGAISLQTERLATNRQLQNIDGIAAALWDIAQIELGREEFAGALASLWEAWPLLQRLGRVDGIAVVGPIYGQLLAAAGETPAAIEALMQSAAACRKIGRMADAEQVDVIIDSIQSDKP